MSKKRKRDVDHKLLELPDELIEIVFDYLSMKNLHSMMLTCKDLHNLLISNPCYFVRRFPKQFSSCMDMLYKLEMYKTIDIPDKRQVHFMIEISITTNKGYIEFIDLVKHLIDQAQEHFQLGIKFKLQKVKDGKILSYGKNTLYFDKSRYTIEKIYNLCMFVYSRDGMLSYFVDILSDLNYVFECKKLIDNSLFMKILWDDDEKDD